MTNAPLSASAPAPNSDQKPAAAPPQNQENKKPADTKSEPQK
jgi:hypothetical protein